VKKFKIYYSEVNDQIYTFFDEIVLEDFGTCYQLIDESNEFVMFQASDLEFIGFF